MLSPPRFGPFGHSCPAALYPLKPTTRRTFARRSTNPYTDHHSAKKSLGIITALLPRSPRKVPLGRARLPPSRSQLPVFTCHCSPTTVARAFLPGRLLPTQNPQHGPPLPVAQPVHIPTTTQQTRASESSPSCCSVVVTWASARVIPRVQAPPTGQPLAQADEYCRLRLSGCIHPGTEAAPSELFANPIKLQPAGAHVILH